MTVTLMPFADHIWLLFEIDHANALLITDHPYPAARKDDLWRSTCFELFARDPLSGAYVEYNFAPAAAWAAYCFRDYRSGQTSPPVQAPHMVDGRIEGHANETGRFDYAVTLTREGVLRGGDLLIGLSAVIEERDGTKSYWALRHPPGDRPDFHHPDCFALALSPASEA